MIVFVISHAYPRASNDRSLMAYNTDPRNMVTKETFARNENVSLKISISTVAHRSVLMFLKTTVVEIATYGSEFIDVMS